jgi:zinc transport system substrate-binding protein
MIPPGASPENYAPTPQIMEELSQARVYFAIGVPAETDGIMPRLQTDYADLKIVDLADQVDSVYPALEMAPGKTDPHRWMSPRRVQEMAKIIASELSTLDPDNAQVYEKNAEAFQEELSQLDTEIKETLAGVTGKSFIVYHPALGYLASDYGLNMISLEAEGKEADPQRLQNVIDQAKKEKIKVIFYQAEMDSKQAQTLAEELGGKAELIAPLSPDYIDNLKKIADTFARVLQEQ